ncbi:hypothetical protein ACFX12_003064 [Malus domestica]
MLALEMARDKLLVPVPEETTQMQAQASAAPKKEKQSYLKMMTESDAVDLMSNDFKELSAAAKKLASHTVRLGSLGFGTTFLK